MQDVIARRSALVAGVLGTVSVVGVIGGEVAMGEDFIGSMLATFSGWSGFASSALFVLAITGVLAGAARVPGQRTRARAAAWVLQLGATVMCSAAATLPLVVVGTHDRYPDLVNEPPTAVPATYILSSFVIGIAGIVLALALKRSGAISGRASTFLIVASVVAMVPLPSRHFLLAFAVAGVLAAMSHQRSAGSPSAPATQDAVSLA